jgi:hypothetical protein
VRTALIMNFEPISSVFLGTLVLGQYMTPLQLTGAAIVVGAIVFTASGLAWLQAYQAAVEQAQAELAEAVGDEVATVVALGLEAYCGH